MHQEPNHDRGLNTLYEQPAVPESTDQGAVALSLFSKRPEYQIPQWFCVQTKPSYEVRVVLSLKDLTTEIQQNIGEIELYFPRIKTKMPVGGHLRPIIKPLFPRYFFAKFIWSKAARFVASRPRVIGLIQFGCFPAIVPPIVIEELKAWSHKTDSEIFDPNAQLQSGQRVLIKSGPFKGMEAEFIVHMADQKRVALLLDHLQSQARLILDRSNLTPIL